MSHFYGTIESETSKTTRIGDKSGLVTHAAGWSGAVRVELTHNPLTGTDHYEITITPWENSGGKSRYIASGTLDASVIQ